MLRGERGGGAYQGAASHNRTREKPLQPTRAQLRPFRESRDAQPVGDWSRGLVASPVLHRRIDGFARRSESRAQLWQHINPLSLFKSVLNLWRRHPKHFNAFFAFFFVLSFVFVRFHFGYTCPRTSMTRCCSNQRRVY